MPINTKDGNRWSQSVAIGAKGVALAIAEMYDHQIVPCPPLVDIGYDLITAHNNVLKRVQVKSTTTDYFRSNGSFTFSVKRRKSYNNRRQSMPPMSYAGNEIDAFIFVQTTHRLFFIVPSAEIDYARHKIAFPSTSPWRDAWHVLRS